MTVDESAVRRFHITNPDFPRFVGPDLSMLTREDFGIEITVHRCWDGLCIGLSTNAQDLGVKRHVNLLLFEGVVHRSQGQDGRGFGRLSVGLPGAILLGGLDHML